MATNRKREDGRKMSITLTHPTSVSSGEPCRVENATCVALTDERTDGKTTVDFGPAVYDLSVKAEDDDGNSPVVIGQQLFYVDADVGSGTGYLNKKVSGYFYGFAMEAINTGVTSTINVLIVPSPGPGKLDIPASIGASEIQAGALAVSAEGRAIMATGYFDAATALDKFAADSIANAFLLDAVADGAFQADAGTRALFAAGIWTEDEIANGALTADADGRAIMATGYFDQATALDKFATDSIDNTFLLDAVADGSFAADAPTRALFATGIWEEDQIAAGALTADADGRAIMATDYFDAATALDKFAADSIANAFLLDAVANGAFAADAPTRALFATGIWEAGQLATDSVTFVKILDDILTGAKVATVANANVIGGIPVLHRIFVADGAGDTDVVFTEKTRVIDVWMIKSGGSGAGGDAIQIFNGANAITDNVACITDKTIYRAATISDTYHEIAAGGTLKCTASYNTDNEATVYVLGVKVA